MFHETVMTLTLMGFLLVAGPLAAADRLVDGVPLPGNAKAATVVETDPTELRQWAGAWVGAWGGTLKHILLVESVTADGLARIVYAIGDNPWLGIRRGWSLHEATVSGRRLTISEAGFSATYDLNDQGGLSATYIRGKIVSHAAMTKTDFDRTIGAGCRYSMDSREIRAFANHSDRRRQTAQSRGGDLQTRRSGAVPFGGVQSRFDGQGHRFSAVQRNLVRRRSRRLSE